MRIFVGVPTFGTFYLQKVESSDREKSPGAFLHPKLSAALSTDRLAGRGARFLRKVVVVTTVCL